MVEIHFAQLELIRFGNRKSIEMKNTIAEGNKGNMGLIYRNYKGFKTSKNLLVFKIKM
jgi:hypothetical protein